MLGTKPEFMEHKLTRPWSLALRIGFFLVLGLAMLFLFYGMFKQIGTFNQGTLWVDVSLNDNSEITLHPESGYESQAPGVTDGDVLLLLDGQAVEPDVEKVYAQMEGKAGDVVTLLVRKVDGSQESLALKRFSTMQAFRLKYGWIADGYMGFHTYISVLVGLLFAGLGIYSILRRGNDGLFVLAGFALLLFPYSLNAAGVAYPGAVELNLNVLYQLMRGAGLLLTCWLLFIFPTGKFIPRWTSWVLLAMVAWLIPYLASLIVDTLLPGTLLDIIWMVLLAFAIGCLVYRYLRADKILERPTLTPMLIGAALAFGFYLLIWLLQIFGLPGSLDTVPFIWYFLVANTLLDVGFLAFGFGLARGLKKLAA